MTSSLLVYDGDCGFCTKSAKFAEAGLPSDVRVEPWQALDLDELGLTEHDVTTAAWWFDADGRKYRGSHAAAEVLVASRSRVRRVLGHVMRIPPISWIAVAVYAVVARYRYKLPGSTDACRVPQDR